jgi:hypothetical protein
MTAAQEHPDNDQFYKAGVLKHTFQITIPFSQEVVTLKKGRPVVICGACQWWADITQRYYLVLINGDAIPVPIPANSIMIVNDDRN